MSDLENKKVLRYAELAVKLERTRKDSAKDKKEMEEIQVELGKDHNAILELAKQRLFPED